MSRDYRGLVRASLIASSLAFACLPAYGQTTNNVEGDQENIGGNKNTGNCYGCTFYGGGSSAPARQTSGGTMSWRNGRFVEGEGDINTFFGSKGECAQACLSDSSCKFIEYYRPENKCNLFSATRSSQESKDADIAIKQ